MMNVPYEAGERRNESRCKFQGCAMTHKTNKGAMICHVISPLIKESGTMIIYIVSLDAANLIDIYASERKGSDNLFQMSLTYAVPFDSLLLSLFGGFMW